jgi:hypothetical protein
MGLFGGSFATGLATGLATSVGETISDDRQRREARLDKLRTFYETRQVQEQDRAKAEDRRTQKHLERLKNETGAGAAEVVAVYKGLGGDNDSLDRHFSRVDANADLGGTFDYTDMLKNSGVDFSQYGNFTMQDALDNFRYEISDVDAKFTESPSFLTAIGLGLDKDTVNKSLTQGIQDIVPSVSRKDSGIAAMAVPEGFYRQTMPAQKAQLDLIIKDSEERVNVAFDGVQKINKKIADLLKNKDTLSGEAYKLEAEKLDNELKEATKNYEAEQENNAKLNAQELSGKEIVSLNLRVSSYDAAIRALDESIEFGGVGDTAEAKIADGDTFTTIKGLEKKAGDSITGEDATKYRAQKKYEYQYNMVENMLTDDDGNFVERSAMNMMDIQGGVGRIPYSVYIDFLKNRKSNNAGDVPVTGGGGPVTGGDVPVTGGGGPGADGGTGGETPILSQEQQQGAIAALVETNYPGQELTDLQYTNIVTELVKAGIVKTEEAAAQAVENYKAELDVKKEKEQYDSLSPEDRMAYNDTAFDEFITPTEEGASPLTMNEEVRILARKSATGIGRILTNQQANKIAENITDEFLKNKLFRTDAEVEGMRSSAMYNDIREKLRLKILDILPNLE